MPSKSKAQQKFMGMVHSLQKGDMKPSDASPEVKKAAKSMGKKDAKDYASTSHKGLPKKVKQEIARKLKEYATKMGKDHMGGDSIPSQNKGGLRDNDGYDNVDYNRDMEVDENFPSNWLQGRVSDYHTKKGTTPRDTYDKTNFNTKHSGQEDLEDDELEESGKDKSEKNYKDWKKSNVSESSDTLEMLKLLNKAMSTMPNSPKQKEIIKKLNILRVKNKMKPLKEAGYSLSDLIGQVKTFDKPKDEKLLTIKVINKLKEKRNNSKSKSNKAKVQKLIDKIEGDYKKGKYLKEYGAISHGYHLEPSQEDKLKGTPEDKMAIDEVGIFPIQAFIKDLIPGNIIRTVTPQDKERLKSTLKDLIFTLNKFWKQHNIPYRVRESVSEVAKRDYKAEYKKFQSSTKSKKYRAELNKYNRQKGTYGNGDGKDASHKGGKIVGFETESKNRGRREKSRLKKK